MLWITSGGHGTYSSFFVPGKGLQGDGIGREIRGFWGQAIMPAPKDSVIQSLAVSSSKKMSQATVAKEAPTQGPRM